MKTDRILISRTDNIGDVILTLPMATVLKQNYPESTILFLGKPYTKPIIDECRYVDEYFNWEEIRQDQQRLKDVRADMIIHVFNNREVANLARQAGIKYRLATSHRLYNLWTCNRFVHFSRRKSDLHEAQLNLKMLAPLKIHGPFPRDQIKDLYGWKNGRVDKNPFRSYLSEKKFNLILHIKSFGNAKDWDPSYFLQLAERLPAERFHLIITGTEEEGNQIRKDIPKIMNLSNSIDVTGKFDMDAFFRFVPSANGLVACSTGPLHIAAARGIHALGLYPSARPKHAGRWGPLGPKTEYIEDTNPMDAPLNIPVDEVFQKVMKWVT